MFVILIDESQLRLKIKSLLALPECLVHYSLLNTQFNKRFADTDAHPVILVIYLFILKGTDFKPNTGM